MNSMSTCVPHMLMALSALRRYWQRAIRIFLYKPGILSSKWSKNVLCTTKRVISVSAVTVAVRGSPSMYLPEKVPFRQLPDHFPVLLDSSLPVYDKNELPPFFLLLSQNPACLHLHLICVSTDFSQMALAEIAKHRYPLRRSIF
jgi:hypothetical protein